MVTVAALRSDLQERLGLLALPAAESTRLDHAVNAAVALVLGDRAPGLTESYTGRTYGALSVTVSSHTADTATVTLSATPAATFPGDIFDDGSNEYVIRDVDGADLDLGAPVPDQITGTGTITRRAIELPHAGSVVAVAELDGNELDPRPNAASIHQTDTGIPHAFFQRYSSGLDKSFVGLYPAPTSERAYLVTQTRATTEDADIDVSYGVLQRILATAHIVYLSWIIGPTNLGAALSQSIKTDSTDLSGGGSEDTVYERG